MSLENALAFAKKLESDKELMKKVLAGLTEDIESSIGKGIVVAKENGFEFSVDDWKACLEELHKTAAQNAELSDDDLEQVAGGLGAFPPGYYADGTKKPR